MNLFDEASGKELFPAQCPELFRVRLQVDPLVLQSAIEQVVGVLESAVKGDGIEQPGKTKEKKKEREREREKTHTAEKTMHERAKQMHVQADGAARVGTDCLLHVSFTTQS